MRTSRNAAEDTPIRRLGVDDWLQAGYSILAEQGIKALKVDNLCAHLGVTKGSFYWHFDGMPTFREALIESWGRLRQEDERDFDDMADLVPRERLARMMASLVSPRHWTLERAMREWARSDEAVAGGVRDADRRTLRAVRRAFVDLGFEPADAELRATATFAAGIGFLHMTGPIPVNRDAALIDRFLDLMLAN